jgi:ATP-dependent helicase HrpB
MDAVALPLPIDDVLPHIRATLQRHRAVVIVAAPGAGKTTRVPPSLAADGQVLLLQPRRVAARSIAKRIAAERGWTLGQQVGWHVRHERHFSQATRLLIATEGILTARLQQDPLLSDFRTVVLDEFHERSIHADVGLALARQAWLARDDLSLVVMSATLNAGPVASYLGDCPVIDLPGTSHPLDIRYRPEFDVTAAVREAAASTAGRILCFVSGAREVRDCAADIRRHLSGMAVAELHGTLTSDEQDRVLTSTSRVIVATNIAETSLTVQGVSAVVDGGQHKVARYDTERAVDTLRLERISQDSADQRSGRAARLGPGIAVRLWSANDRLRLHREPDITRLDLSGPILDILVWGGDPWTFDWFEPPPPGRVERAILLLQQLGAVDGRQVTPLGRDMSVFPLHPRLSRILIAAGGAEEAAIACALLGDPQQLPRHPPTTTCDLAGLTTADLAPHVQRTTRELQRLARKHGTPHLSDEELRRALLAGYPDRVARRRNAGDRRVVLASGHGAVVSDESGVRDGEFLVALDVQGARRGEQSEARIRIASRVEREWLQTTHTQTRYELDAQGAVQRADAQMYGAITLRVQRSVPSSAEAVEHLVPAFLAQPLEGEDEQLIRRLRFAGLAIDVSEIVTRAAANARTLKDIGLEDGLDWNVRQQLERLAPRRFTTPSGRSHALEYRHDGTVTLSVKVQELFGLAESPRIGPHHEPLLILLLAPNGRPVQTTRDLRSFWTTTYQEVRKELRGRYPKHPWPEDPWTARATSKTTRASRGR